MLAAARAMMPRPWLGAFDAMLTAAGIRIRAEAIVSADRAFAGIGDLSSIDGVSLHGVGAVSAHLRDPADAP